MVAAGHSHHFLWLRHLVLGLIDTELRLIRRVPHSGVKPECLTDGVDGLRGNTQITIFEGHIGPVAVLGLPVRVHCLDLQKLVLVGLEDKLLIMFIGIFEETLDEGVFVMHVVLGLVLHNAFLPEILLVILSGVLHAVATNFFEMDVREVGTTVLRVFFSTSFLYGIGDHVVFVKQRLADLLHKLLVIFVESHGSPLPLTKHLQSPHVTGDSIGVQDTEEPVEPVRTVHTHGGEVEVAFPVVLLIAHLYVFTK